MDDFDELRASEFVTDTDDQDSLDERIDSEQSLRNQQLWVSFQNAACCITKLYKDRAQPNVSLWLPFQNAASNLTTLYKDCIESQRRFAKIGYQIGKRKRKRATKSNILHRRSHSSQSRHLQAGLDAENGQQHHHYHHHHQSNNSTFGAQASGTTLGQNPQQTPPTGGVASILAVNQLNLNCDELPSHSMQAQTTNELIDQQQQHTIIDDFQQPSLHHNSHHQHHDYHHPIQSATTQHQQQQLHHQSSAHLAQPLSNNEDNLVTFQQALVQPAVIRSLKQSGQNINSSSNNNNTSMNINNRSGNTNTQSYLNKSEEDRLMELNRFLAEEYHRHVGSRKRSCTAVGGNTVKRVRE